MPIRTLKQVTSVDIREVRKAIQAVGSGPTQIAGLSRRLNIAESDMAALVTAITTTPKPRALVTESALTETTPVAPGMSAQDLRKMRLAEQVQAGANRALEDLHGASIGDLENLAAMVGWS